MLVLWRAVLAAAWQSFLQGDPRLFVSILFYSFLYHYSLVRDLTTVGAQ